MLLQIFWKKLYWNVSGVVLYQLYEFCPNHWFWLVACNIYSILAEYSLHSCTFRWVLWPTGLWLYVPNAPVICALCGRGQRGLTAMFWAQHCSHSAVELQGFWIHGQTGWSFHLSRAFGRTLPIKMSLQCWAYTQALQRENLRSVGAVVTNNVHN